MNPVQRAVERFLLARYAPACVLIDDGLNIRYFHGETSRYLEHVHGPASLNLQKLARPGLLVELASTIQAARTEGAPVRREGIPVDVEGESQEIDLEVMPLTVVDTDTRCFLILFAQSSPRGAARRATGWLAHLWGKGWRAAPRRGATAPEPETDRRIQRLTRELEATRDYLQVISEAHEAAQEELKSAHEEVLSANEKFHSTNEELETAKEELQSTNKELTTTNEELGHRNCELNTSKEAETAARDYAEGIIETMSEPLLMLDGELRVMRANSAPSQPPAV
ncbi:MAG: coiled-coil domain-containing protein [Chromatiales bacterium]